VADIEWLAVVAAVPLADEVGERVAAAEDEGVLKGVPLSVTDAVYM
jgi:hypothetical protein